MSIAGYPDAVREQFEIGEDMRILCGLAVGYLDPGFEANSLMVPRNPIADNVRFVDE